MRLLRLVFLVVPFLMPPAVYARDAKLGDSTVRVSPPTGFCEVDQTNKADSSWLTSVTNLMNSAKIYTIAAFPDCRQMQRARKTSQFIDTKIYVTAPYAAIGKLTPQLVQQTCDELRTKEYSEQDKIELAKAIKEFSNGNTGQDSQALGVLEDVKGVVCYVATLQKIKLKNGEPQTTLALFAVTSVQNSEIFLYQFTPYVDASSMSTALANLKIIYNEFANANKK